MPANRLVQLIAGAVVALIGLPLLLAGLVVGWLHVTERDDDGFFTTGTEQVATPARALVSEEVDLGASPTEDDWVPFDGDLATVRLRVEGPEGLFVGIGPTDDVAAYLAGVDRAVIRDGLFVPGDLEFDRSTGDVEPGPPAAETFWAATGTQELTWDVERGRWTVVVMRADGGAGVEAALQAGVRLEWLLAVAVVSTMLGAGLLGGGVWAAVAASRAAGRERSTGGARRPYPVRLDGHLDEPLSRWLWLVKWFLALPHVVVLVGLWIAFAVTTTIAWFAILLTGR